MADETKTEGEDDKKLPPNQERFEAMRTAIKKYLDDMQEGDFGLFVCSNKDGPHIVRVARGPVSTLNSLGLAALGFVEVADDIMEDNRPTRPGTGLGALAFLLGAAKNKGE